MTKIRVRHGENEIELERTDAFINKHLGAFYQRISVKGPEISAPPVKLEVEVPAKKRSTKPPTPAEFYNGIGKTDGVSKILIFAKYLELYRDKSEFVRADINSLVSEAKLSKDIHSQYFTNTVKQGLLRSLAGSKYTLTLSAEEVLASMQA